MAIDRISSSALAPILPPRPESGALALPALVTPGVAPLLPVGPFTTLLPENAIATLAAPPSSQQSGGQPGAQTAGTAAAEAGARTSTAMQPNQLFFSRQMVWQAPDAGALASSWRVMVKTYGQQRVAMQDQVRGQHVPSSLLMAEQNPSAVRDGARAPQPMLDEGWRFGVYGWGGQRLLLRVLPGQPEEDKDKDGRRRRARAALRLELTLAGGAIVLIQMEPAGEAVTLDLATTDIGALQYLRKMLPGLARAIGDAGVRIARCRLGRELVSAPMANDGQLRAAAAGLTQSVFRAMAEAALFISQPGRGNEEGGAERDAAPVPTPEAPPEPLLPELAGVPREVPAPPQLGESDGLHGDWQWED
jgi:hypothetical protein